MQNFLLLSNFKPFLIVHIHNYDILINNMIVDKRQLNWNFILFTNTIYSLDNFKKSVNSKSDICVLSKKYNLYCVWGKE